MENMNTIEVILSVERVTKNCIKFAEKTESEFSVEKLGSVYIQKSTFAECYKGQDIVLTLYIADEEAGLTFTAEKPTKTTVKFAEDVASEYALAKIGSLYIPKTTLSELGWRPDLKQKIAVAIVTK